MGVRLALVDDSRALDVDAPAGTLTPELVALLREHKAALVELVYSREEREAIIEEGCEGETRVTFEGDADLVAQARTHDSVAALKFMLRRMGGGTIEVRRRPPAAAA